MKSFPKILGALIICASIAWVLSQGNDDSRETSLAADSIPTGRESVQTAPSSSASSGSTTAKAGAQISDDQLPPEARHILNAIPAGPFRTTLLRLDAPARTRVLQGLAKYPVPVEDYASLQVDPNGGLFYACRFPTSAGATASAMSAMGTVPEPRPDLDSVQNLAQARTMAFEGPVPISSPPIRHSRPGATRILYLDFNGHTITGTQWNAYYGQSTYQARPYDTDGDPTTFSEAEQAAIIQIWERVAEDYAPFDVDVTTEEPAIFTRYTGRALITMSVDANNKLMPLNTAGGVAYLNVFGIANYSFYSPALVYADNLGAPGTARLTANIAECISHELGHNMGLSHDGQAGVEYYLGHGTGSTSWAPIMGAGYDRNVSQWSKGEYAQANNQQDDLAIIAGKLGYRRATVGATLAAATMPEIVGNTFTVSEVLLKEGEPHFYVFATGAGPISLSATTYRAATGTRGGNADIKLELIRRDSGYDTVLATSDPLDSTDTTLNYNAPAGTYYLRLTASGTGNPITGYSSYASVGQYTLTGDIIATQPTILSPLSATINAGELFSYAIDATGNPSSYNAAGLPAGLILDPVTGIISGRTTTEGVFDITLSATNTIGIGSATLQLTVVAGPPVILSQTTSRQVLSPGESLVLDVSAFSLKGPLSYQWKRNGLPVTGVTGPNLPLTDVTTTDTGYYQAIVTDNQGTMVRSAAIFVRIAPTTTKVEAWGSAEEGLLNVPAGLNDAVAISAQGKHALALKSDGTVAGWGTNGNNEGNVPSDLGDVVAIAAGNTHSVALRADGRVVAWGNNSSGQTNVPANLTDVVAIAAGGSHTLALKADGTIVAWGLTTNGQTAVPASLSDVVAISAGNSYSLALKADRTIVAWGSTLAGTHPASASAIAGGSYHALALKTDGTVASWGNTYGTIPSDLANVTAIAAGGYHSLALGSNGLVAAWGTSTSGQTAIPPTLANVFAIAAAASTSYALRDAADDYFPVIETHPVTQSVPEEASITFVVGARGGTSPLKYQWRKDGTPITGATSASLTLAGVVLDDAGSYDVIVTNPIGSATSNAATLTIKRIPTVTVPSAIPVRQILDTGASISLRVDASSTVTATDALTYQWYHAGRPIEGATSVNYNRVALLSDSGAYWVAVTDANGTRLSPIFFVHVVPDTTEFVAWGTNTRGQLDTLAPGTGSNRWITFSTGIEHVLAVKHDGSVYGWGANDSNGRLTIPVSLAAPGAGVVAVAAGTRHSLALKSDGTVIGWGYPLAATPPSGLTDVVEIAAGNSHSLALKSNGTVVAWGDDTYGKATVPAGLSDVVSIATTREHSLALKRDGTVIAWGNNTSQECAVPSNLQNVTAIAAGNAYSLAISSTQPGVITQWGTNLMRTPPAGPDEIIDIAAGHYHAIALKNDDNNSLDVWGPNTPNVATILPAGLDNTYAIGAGNDYSIVLRDASSDIAPTITSGPKSVTIKEGQTAFFAVTATGNPLRYQWMKNGEIIPGAIKNILQLTNVTSADAGDYTVQVSNARGSVTSEPTATLAISYTPQITTQPVTQNVFAGEAVELTVTANGVPSPSYQWWKNGARIPGATSDVLQFPNVAITDAGSYFVTVYNNVGTATSVTVALIVKAPPAITHQPLSVTVQAGSSARFSTTVTGSPTPSGQWQRKSAEAGADWVALTNNEVYLGVTTTTLSVTNTTVGMSGDQFRFVADNGLGEPVASDIATLTVVSLPKITLQPASATAHIGGAVSFAVTANGHPAPSYQWYRNGVAIPDATHATLSLINIGGVDAGYYSCQITNAAGTILSNPTLLTVILYPATIELLPESLAQVYNGTAREAAVKVTAPAAPDNGADLPRIITYDGKDTAPINAGAYKVTARLTAPDYEAASVEGTLVVAKAVQLIAFGELPVLNLHTTTLDLRTYAQTNSGLPVTFTSSDETVAKIADGILTVIGPGTTTLTASQAGNLNYNPAPSVSHILTVDGRGVPSPETTHHARLGSTLALDLTGGVPPETSTRYYAKKLPKGLKLDAKTGLITGRITAAPGNYVVTYWTKTGKVTSSQSTLVIRVNPFPSAITGQFDGLLLAADGLPAGRFELNVTNKATLTGKLYYQDGKSYSLRSNLITRSDGTLATAQLLLAKGKPTVDILLLAADSAAVLYLSQGTTIEAQCLDGERRTLTVSPWLGSYTAVLNPLETSVTAPEGFGYVTLTIDSSSKMKIKGKAADAAPLTGTLPCSTQGTYVWWLKAGKTSGASIGGNLRFERRSDGSYHAGEATDSWLIWTRPPNPKERSYRAGFGPLALVPEVMPWPRFISANTDLPTQEGQTAGLLLLGAGIDNTESAEAETLPSGLPRNFAIGAKNQLLVVDGENTGWKGKITPDTGLFTATFTLNEPAKRKVTIEGVLLQAASDSTFDGILGAGYFILPPTAKGAPLQSGAVILSTTSNAP